MDLNQSHASLPLSGRLVGDFRPIVQLVGDNPPGHAALTFQQPTEEAFSRMPIAARLEHRQFLDVDIAVQKEDRALWTIGIDRAAISEAAHEG
jgi:hypothetical protein